MKSRMRERRTYGSVRGLRREPLVYSTDLEKEVNNMRVQNRVMLHISRENRWKVGDTLTSGLIENPFWLSCKDYSPIVAVNQQTMPLFKMFDQFSTFDVTQNNIEFLYQNLKNISKEVAFYIREQVFEEVRKDHFSHLPSRQKCLWVTEEKQLPYWKTMEVNKQRYLLTLELNGDLFCGDAYWLTADTFSSVEYKKRANDYWSGKLRVIPRKEYLFNGDAIIKEISSFK